MTAFRFSRRRGLGPGGGFLTLHKGGACVLAPPRLGRPGAEHRRHFVVSSPGSHHEGGVSIIIPGLDIRTAIEEKLHRRDLAFLGSHHEGGESIILPGLDISAAIEEKLHHRKFGFQRPPHGSIHDGGCSILISGIDICTAIKEKLHHRDVAPMGSRHESGVSIRRIPGLDVRTAIEEVFSQRRIAVHCCFN